MDKNLIILIVIGVIAIGVVAFFLLKGKDKDDDKGGDKKGDGGNKKQGLSKEQNALIDFISKTLNTKDADEAEKNYTANIAKARQDGKDEAMKNLPPDQAKFAKDKQKLEDDLKAEKTKITTLEQQKQSLDKELADIKAVQGKDTAQLGNKIPPFDTAHTKLATLKDKNQKQIDTNNTVQELFEAVNGEISRLEQDKITAEQAKNNIEQAKQSVDQQLQAATAQVSSAKDSMVEKAQKEVEEKINTALKTKYTDFDEKKDLLRSIIKREFGDVFNGEIELSKYDDTVNIANFNPAVTGKDQVEKNTNPKQIITILKMIEVSAQLKSLFQGLTQPSGYISKFAEQLKTIFARNDAADNNNLFSFNGSHNKQAFTTFLPDLSKGLEVTTVDADLGPKDLTKYVKELQSLTFVDFNAATTGKFKSDCAGLEIPIRKDDKTTTEVFKTFKLAQPAKTNVEMNNIFYETYPKSAEAISTTNPTDNYEKKKITKDFYKSGADENKKLRQQGIILDQFDYNILLVVQCLFSVDITVAATGNVFGITNAHHFTYEGVTEASDASDKGTFKDFYAPGLAIDKGLLKSTDFKTSNTQVCVYPSVTAQNTSVKTFQKLSILSPRDFPGQKSQFKFLKSIDKGQKTEVTFENLLSVIKVNDLCEQIFEGAKMNKDEQVSGQTTTHKSKIGFMPFFISEVDSKKAFTDGNYDELKKLINQNLTSLCTTHTKGILLNLVIFEDGKGKIACNASRNLTLRPKDVPLTINKNILQYYASWEQMIEADVEYDATTKSYATQPSIYVASVLPLITQLMTVGGSMRLLMSFSTKDNSATDHKWLQDTYDKQKIDKPHCLIQTNHKIMFNSFVATLICGVFSSLIVCKNDTIGSRTKLKNLINDVTSDLFTTGAKAGFCKFTDVADGRKPKFTWFCCQFGSELFCVKCTIGCDADGVADNPGTFGAARGLFEFNQPLIQIITNIGLRYAAGSVTDEQIDEFFDSIIIVTTGDDTGRSGTLAGTKTVDQLLAKDNDNLTTATNLQIAKFSDYVVNKIKLGALKFLTKQFLTMGDEPTDIFMYLEGGNTTNKHYEKNVVVPTQALH